jgi:hypothetical protein
MKLKMSLLVAVTALAIPVVARMQQKRVVVTPAVTQATVSELLASEFGSNVKVTQFNSSDHAEGDFNGDGYQDIAVMVNIESATGDLKPHGVRLFDTDPYSQSNGMELDPAKLEVHNCSGLAIVHGSVGGWRKPLAKFMIYNCFSSVKLFAKGSRIKRSSQSKGITPRPLGDFLLLDLENGGQAIVYWNGKSYRGFGLGAAD